MELLQYYGLLYLKGFGIAWFSMILIAGLEGDSPTTKQFYNSCIWPVYVVSGLGLLIRGIYLTIKERV